MRTFEITTPALRDAVNACKEVLSGQVDGEEARNKISASNSVVAAVGQELKVRLAMPKLLAAEAKAIDSNQHQQQAIAS